MSNDIHISQSFSVPKISLTADPSEAIDNVIGQIKLIANINSIDPVAYQAITGGITAVQIATDAAAISATQAAASDAGAQAALTAAQSAQAGAEAAELAAQQISNDSVTLTGDQTVAGVKSFSSNIIADGGLTTVNAFLAMGKKIVIASGHETLSGDTANTLTTKSYVDSLNAALSTQYAALVHTHAAADIVSGTFDNARISASAITQHQAQLSLTEAQITDLQNYSLVGHGHTKAQISDFSDNDYATASQGAKADSALQALPAHTHTKAEISDFSDSDYAAASHTHTKAQITDFNDADYATALQGSKADSALQSLALDGLTDVAVSGAASGQNLGFDGTNWVPTNAGAAGVTDHGALTGNDDDDHPHYHTDARGDARYLRDLTGEGITTLLDVHVPSPAADHVLTYDIGNARWESKSLPASVVDHGALTGLADDDHPQYHNNTRGDARYAQISHTHNASDITAGLIDPARIGETAVTQYQAGIFITESQISDLKGYLEKTGGTVTGALIVNADLTVGDGSTNVNPIIDINSYASGGGNPIIRFKHDNTETGRITGEQNNLLLKHSAAVARLYADEFNVSVQIKGIDGDANNSFMTKSYIDQHYPKTGGQITGNIQALSTNTYITAETSNDSNAHFQLKRNSTLSALLFARSADVVLRKYSSDGTAIASELSLADNGNAVFSGNVLTGNSVIVQAGIDENTHLYFRENGVNRGLLYYAAVGGADTLAFRNYATDGVTINNEMAIGSGSTTFTKDISIEGNLTLDTASAAIIVKATGATHAQIRFDVDGDQAGFIYADSNNDILRIQKRVGTGTVDNELQIRSTYTLATQPVRLSSGAITALGDASDLVHKGYVDGFLNKVTTATQVMVANLIIDRTAAAYLVIGANGGQAAHIELKNDGVTTGFVFTDTINNRLTFRKRDATGTKAELRFHDAGFVDVTTEMRGQQGVSSNAYVTKAQLDTKADTAGDTFTDDVTISTGKSLIMTADDGDTTEFKPPASIAGGSYTVVWPDNFPDNNAEGFEVKSIDATNRIVYLEWDT